MSNSITLRDYQQQAVDETEASIAFGSDNLIIEMPTGAGKSIVIAGLVNTLSDKNIVIMVNIEPLIDQIAEHLDIFNLDYSILKANRDSEFDESKSIQLIMSQTYYARHKSLNIKADIIIIDERHREYSTQRTLKLFSELKPTTIIGLSATPFTSEGYKLHNSETIRTVDMKTLTEQGHLAPIKYYTAKWSESVDYSKAKKSGSDYSANALDTIVNTDKHISLVVRTMNLHNAKKKKTLVFCTTIEQCNKVANALKKDGYQAEAYHSKIDKIKSELIMDSFRNDKPLLNDKPREVDLFTSNEEEQQNQPVRVLCSVSKLNVGFNVPNVELGVMLRKTTSRILHIQSIGRIARTYPGKTHGEWLDLAQTVSSLGFADDPYVPPEYIADSNDNQDNLFKANEHLAMPAYQITMPEKGVHEIDRETYNFKINEIKSDKSKLSSQTVKQLSQKLELEADPKVIIAIVAVLFDKIHSSDTTDRFNRPARGYRAINGKDVINFMNADSIMWIAEPWIEIMQDNSYSDIQKKKWVNALRTRSKNILKEQKSIWSLKFFIEFLLEKYQQDNEGIYEGTIYENKSMPINNMPELPELDELSDEDIPF